LARRISVEIVGDSASLQRSFQRSGASAKVFERDIGKSARGAVAASLSFRGLGRAAAYASGYLLGGAGLAYALKASISNSENLEKAQRSLAVVVQRNGGNFKQQLPIIEKWAAAQDRFGVSTVQAEQGLARATVITGSAAAGMRAYTEALEISKATGKSFSAVLLASAKANAGQTTALARYIGKIPKGTSALKLFTLIQAKYAGQATANTSATDKLGASFSNIETIVGTALLPTVNKYSSELSDWLGKSKNQERITRDVSQAVKEATTVTKDLTAAVKLAAQAVGGFKNLLEGLLVLKIASVATAWATGFAAAGTAAAGAATKMERVKGALAGLRLASVAPIIFTVEVIGLRAIANKIKDLQNQALNAAAAPTTDQQKAALVPRLAREYKQYRASGMSAKDAIVKLENQLGAGIHKVRVRDKSDPSGAHDTFKTVGGSLQAADIVASAISYAGGGAEKKRIDALRKKQGETAKKAAAAVKSDASAPLDALSRIQDQVAQARLAVAQKQKGATRKLVAALKAEIDYDKKYAAIQEQLAARGGKDAKKHSQTAQALIASETADLNEITSLTAKHAAAAKKTKKASKVAVASFAVPLGLQLAAARAGATVTTGDDLLTAEKIKAFAQKVLRSGKTTMQTQIDAWNEIAAQNATIAGILGNVGKRTQHSVVESSAQFVKGLHFASLADKQAAEARFAQAQAHGGRVPNNIGVAGQAIVIKNHVILDGQIVANSTTKHQQRSGSYAAVQTRGPQAGRNARVH
jgi:hypothetical protein